MPITGNFGVNVNNPTIVQQLSLAGLTESDGSIRDEIFDFIGLRRTSVFSGCVRANRDTRAVGRNGTNQHQLPVVGKRRRRVQAVLRGV